MFNFRIFGAGHLFIFLIFFWIFWFSSLNLLFIVLVFNLKKIPKIRFLVTLGTHFNQSVCITLHYTLMHSTTLHCVELCIKRHTWYKTRFKLQYADYAKSMQNYLIMYARVYKGVTKRCKVCKSVKNHAKECKSVKSKQTYAQTQKLKVCRKRKLCQYRNHYKHKFV